MTDFTASPPSPRKQRRSFSQQTLALESGGDLAAVLETALSRSGQGGYRLTHGFHPYPGRFHPSLPELLLREVSGPQHWVLDPFMGGGTTLVEGLLQGMGVIGNDLNPIAHLVTRERTRARHPGEAKEVEDEARRIAGQVEALRHEKKPPRYDTRDLKPLAVHYMPHLLAELTQWARLLETIKPFKVRETLRAVFSSAVVKFSKRASDSDDRERATSFPKGAVSRFLVAKTEELVRAQMELGRLIPAGTPPIRLHQEDARLLISLHWGQADHIITSPPYPGTYDYHDHHALRMAWLGLEDAPFKERELGAKREQDPDAWSEDLRDVLLALARVLKPQGNLFMVIGDWIADGRAINAAEALTRDATAKGWRLAGHASAQRESFSPAEKTAYAARGKWEHLLYFRRGVPPRAP